eukprot:scaffold1748_cov164-Amphora_coffeaeformis.AAC.11
MSKRPFASFLRFVNRRMPSSIDDFYTRLAWQMNHTAPAIAWSCQSEKKSFYVNIVCKSPCYLLAGLSMFQAGSPSHLGGTNK